MSGRAAGTNVRSLVCTRSPESFSASRSRITIRRLPNSSRPARCHMRSCLFTFSREAPTMLLISCCDMCSTNGGPASSSAPPSEASATKALASRISSRSNSATSTNSSVRRNRCDSNSEIRCKDRLRFLRNGMKSRWSMTSKSQSLNAMASAVRSPPSSNAISPKTSPELRIASTTSRPFGDVVLMRTPPRAPPSCCAPAILWRRSNDRLGNARNGRAESRASISSADRMPNSACSSNSFPFSAVVSARIEPLCQGARYARSTAYLSPLCRVMSGSKRCRHGFSDRAF